MSAGVRQAVLPFAAPEAEKVVGGFVTIPVQCLAMVWWLFRSGRISRAAFRAYFACHELETRRRLLRKKYDREYHRLIPDFVRLLGGSPDQERSKEMIRSTFRELREIGLVSYGDDFVFRFATDPKALKLSDEERVTLLRNLEKFSHPNRPVPVPRRILRRLAGGMSRSRTGVLIAYLIRCLFYRKGEGVSAKGCCKASWIADAFGISERSVFDSRDYLIHQLGWLSAVAAPQRVLNRYGLWVTVNLKWKDDGASRAVTSEMDEVRPVSIETNAPVQNVEGSNRDSEIVFADPSAHSGTDFAEPLKTSLPSRREGFENQNRPTAETATDDVSGFYSSRTTSETKVTQDTQSPPDIRRVVPEDLKDYERLCDLRRQAIAEGFVTESEADRVRFFAAVIHARNVGKDPVKLFSWMIRTKRWEMITQADEEEAYAKLKAKERARTQPTPELKGSLVSMLSDDACLVDAVLATYDTRRIPRYPRLVHEALKRHDATWSDARFVNAWSELHSGQNPYAPKTS